jgi:tryptophan synthase alpha chain
VSRLQVILEGGEKLIAFIVAGDPTISDSFKAACEIMDSGADILELGLPFSDPLADGPIIQEAGQRALNAGMNTDRYFEFAKLLSKKYDKPLICLTYYNIILQYGLEKFAVSCFESGIEGVVVPDLPIEESKPLVIELRRLRVDFIFLVAETTTEKRLKKILSSASGFIYVVALLGTTGVRDHISPGLKLLLSKIKKRTSLPLAIGFGISKPEHVMKVFSYGGDAAIVGSGIVKIINTDKGSLRGYVKSLKCETLN